MAFNMRTDIGHMAIDCDAGRFEFIPSFKNIRTICEPSEMPSFFAGLMGHDVNAALSGSAATIKLELNRLYDNAVLVMQCCCDDDISPITGRTGYKRWRKGVINQSQLLLLARELLIHGVVGSAPAKTSSKGEPTNSIDVYSYVDMAMAHLKIGQAEAEQYTKTEYDRKIAAKYPDIKKQATLADHKHNIEVLAEINARRKAKKDEVK
jgi:hypothetical protein